MAWQAQRQQGFFCFRMTNKKGGDIAEMGQGAQGAAAEDTGDTDELSEIAHANALESSFVSSDARVIFTDGTCQNDEVSTMGCGGQAQVGQHPTETAGSGTDIAPNTMATNVIRWVVMATHSNNPRAERDHTG